MTGNGKPLRSWQQIFRWPLAMAVANALGLVAALVGDGVYDLISWTALGGTVVLMILLWRRQQRHS